MTHLPTFVQPLKMSEKIGYALGDGAANIAWRGVATFLFIFYTDVFGIHPGTVGVLMLIARFGDGIVDVFMGIVCDRTHTKYGKFRPWILWTAVPLGISLSLLFTAPALSQSGKVWYAYATYLLFFLIYTANNIPYGALMAVMTGDNKERTSLGSYRMVGAFSGGMIVQGALLYLVAHFGNINPIIDVKSQGADEFIVTVSSQKGVENVNIKTKAGIARFVWQNGSGSLPQNEATIGKSFSMEPNKKYVFLVSGEPALSADKISIIDQRKGYSSAIYVLSFFLSFFLLVTFAATKERVLPPADQDTNLKNDFRDLIRNKPWLVLLLIGMLFNVYNSIKQGIVVMYFSHFMQNQLLSASYMVALMLASIGGALIAAPLGKKWGKRKLFIIALLFSGFANALLTFCTPNDVSAIFSIGIISEFGAAIFPTLFFAMLGDVADYSEFVNGRRATGLVYAAGSFATKFGGGIAGAIIGLVLAAYHYNGLDGPSIQGALPGIVMLMSWIPGLVSLLTAAIMVFYPLNQTKMDEITVELQRRRLAATTV